MTNYVRINSSSKRVASYTKQLLEQTLQHKFDFAISTRNFIMLDFDCKNEREKCKDEVLLIARLLVEKHNGYVNVYETPRGYHIIHSTFLPWNEIRNILRALKLLELNYLDKNHIDACLRRGYMTLRLNQKKLVYKITKNGVE